jgi:PD-(D/E)XK nuclease superfamily protein
MTTVLKNEQSGELDAFFQSPEMARLRQAHLRFDPFEALGITGRELSYSTLLAYFLRPSSGHRLGFAFLKAFFNAVLEETSDTASLVPFLAHVDDTDENSVRVWREWRSIDIVVTWNTGDRGDAVVAIENKIWAAEGWKQLARYQNELARQFPKALKAVIFLTPTGRSSDTKIVHPEVVPIEASYGAVQKALKLARDHSHAPEPVRHFLEAVESHVKEVIMGTGELKKAVHGVWANPEHARLLFELIKHRPGLENIRAEYEAGIKQGLMSVTENELDRGDNIGFSLYGTPTREVKFQVPSWCKAGLPLTIMLYHGTTEQRPAVRLFVRPETRSNAMTRLAEIDSDRIHSDFPPLRHWTHWCRVLREEDYPPDSYINDYSYSSETAQEAVHRALGLVDEIDGFLKKIRPQIP